jgi:hypothetical protein
MRTLKTLIGIIFICCMFVFPGIAEGTVVSECKILDSETIINSANTTAYVDTINHEIRLPEAGSFRKISFAGESYDYVVLTEDSAIHYSFNGEEMVENPIASVNNLVNPLSVFSAAYPDVIVSTKTQVTHYSFTGTDMTENPALSIAGLTSVASIASRNNDISVLQGNQADYYAFDGLEMANVPNLSIGGLNNPVEVALFQDTYDVAVLEQDKVRFYYFTGTEMTEAPDLALSGFANPLKSISVDQGTVSIIEGNQVKTYLFDGSEYSYVDALSITDSLSSPSCLALRPGSRDMIIVDNNEVKYFMFDGDELVYNPSLSKQIADFSPIGYITNAVVQSNLVMSSATASRVTAHCEVPPGTSITWSVYAGSWTPVWRIGGASTPIVEYTPNGHVWVASPESLWKEHSETSCVGWRAELRTSNPSVTPKIKAPNPGTDTAVMLEKNSKPAVNLVLEPCYLTMTPTISWDFIDDDGNGQTEYDLRICDDMNYLYSYAAESNIPQHTMLPYEDPATPSPLWNSGYNTFELKIRVKDEVQWSDWEIKPITFRAFERPRVVEVSVPGEEYEPPVINLLATHEVIRHGTDGEELPVTKAGGRITILVDSIGKVNLDPIHGVGSAIFPYLDQTATIGEVTLDETNKNGPCGNKRWKITFWTSPDKTICPDNTIIGMDLIGNSDGYLPELNVQNFADGVARTKGSVYDNWNVVLQGRR